MIFWESDLNFVTVLQTLTRRDQPWTFAVAKTKWSRGPACARRYDSVYRIEGEWSSEVLVSQDLTG